MSPLYGWMCTQKKMTLDTLVLNTTTASHGTVFKDNNLIRSALCLSACQRSSVYVLKFVLARFSSNFLYFHSLVWFISFQKSQSNKNCDKWRLRIPSH